jgi:uncharacterized protein (TIGR03067 family)
MHALLFVALIPSAPAPPEKEKEVPKELKALQGVWKITAVEQNGRPAAAGFAPVTDRPPLVVVGNEFVMLGTQVGTVKADPEKKEIDLTVTDGRSKGQVLPCLFEVSDGTLKLAIPSATRAARGGAPATLERPKELKSEAGSRVALYTFERDTKATKEQAAAKLKEQKERIVAQLGPGAFGPGSAATNEALLRQIIERLDKIDKRLDEMEKRQAKPEK